MNSNPADHTNRTESPAIDRPDLFLEALLQHSSNLVIRAVDRQFRLLFYNTEYQKAFHRIYNVAISRGMSLPDRIPVESDKKKLLDYFSRALQGETFTTVETYGKESEFYFENHFSPIRDEQDCILGVLALSTDLTPQKQAEHALHKTENDFKNLFMAISDGFYLSEIIYNEHDEPIDYRYIDVNPAFEKIAGLAREQIIGKSYTGLVPVDSTQWLDNYITIATTGTPRTFEFYSSEYDMHFETYAYKTAPDQIAVFVRNVTDRKRTDAALANIQKLESLGILAGGIAHDFNNMLGGLFGYIDLSRSYLASGSPLLANQKLSNALQMIDMLKSLSNQLLTFSKGGAPCCAVQQIASLIKNSTTLAISGSTLQSQFIIAPDLAPCNCDKNQIAQVITNIVINAKQAMPEGGLVIVSAENCRLAHGEITSLPSGGSFIHLSIRDHGCGIPKEHVNHIFDPFFTTKASGHGLGLATSHSIIRQHNGALDVESEVGVGTTFHCYLPAVADGAAEKRSTAKNSSYHGHGPVLVMDDDLFMRSIYRDMLRLLGHSIIETAHGAEAVQQFTAAQKSGDPVVFSLLDLTVKGGMGGIETLRHIRACQPSAIVVVVSGYANDPVMATPGLYGFNDSLAKPFVFNDINNLFGRLAETARIDK